MLYGLIRTFILCCCLLSLPAPVVAENANVITENDSLEYLTENNESSEFEASEAEYAETESESLFAEAPDLAVADAEAIVNADEFIADVAALEAELDGLNGLDALDSLELPDVDTSFLAKLKMAGAVLRQDICENPAKYVLYSTATIAVVAAVVCIYKKSQATSPA